MNCILIDTETKKPTWEEDSDEEDDDAEYYTSSESNLT